MNAVLEQPKAVKERPILFSGAMVNAILEDRKTQTRRVVKRCPYGQPGDQLWVKETHRIDGVEPPPGQYTKRLRVRYRADDAKIWFEQGTWPSGSILDPEHWTPSIYMPRWASRITLEIVSVRVERLQDITEEDAKAEGCYPEFEVNVAQFVRDKHWNAVTASTYKLGYKHLWDSINGKTHPWSSNPWVWRIEFKRL